MDWFMMVGPPPGPVEFSIGIVATVAALLAVGVPAVLAVRQVLRRSPEPTGKPRVLPALRVIAGFVPAPHRGSRAAR